jgi:hypothetical protein
LEETLINALLCLRKMVARGAVVIAIAGCACTAAYADTLVQTVILTPSGSDSRVTNGDVYTVFNDAVDFNQFNTTLGTLTSATLSWTGTGSLTVSGSYGGFDGQAIMSTVNFSISGVDSLSLAGLTGSGSVNEGSIDETFQNTGGTFPDTYDTGSTTGTFTLTYGYSPSGEPSDVPELSSFTYFFTTLVLVTPGLRRWARKNS